MSLVDQLNADLKTAMKAQNRVAMETIRSLKKMLRDKEIEKKVDLSEQEQMKVLLSAAKRRRESIESYEQGGRQELADQEKAELKVIEQYLPEQMSQKEITSLVEKVIEETGAFTMRDMGMVMGKIMPQVQGKADGNEVKNIVQQKLS